MAKAEQCINSVQIFIWKIKNSIFVIKQLIKTYKTRENTANVDLLVILLFIIRWYAA